MTDKSLVERAVVALETYHWHDSRTDAETVFDVTAGWARVRTRPAESDQVTVVPVALHFAQILRGDAVVTWRHVPEVDPRNPGLVGEWGGGFILIDGWHRLARAHAWGWAGFPAYVLTAAETAALIFDPADPAQLRTHLAAAWADQAGAADDPDLETEAEWRNHTP